MTLYGNHQSNGMAATIEEVAENMCIIDECRTLVKVEMIRDDYFTLEEMVNKSRTIVDITDKHIDTVSQISTFEIVTGAARIAILSTVLNFLIQLLFRGYIVIESLQLSFITGTITGAWCLFYMRNAKHAQMLRSINCKFIEKTEQLMYNLNNITTSFEKLDADEAYQQIRSIFGELYEHITVEMLDELAAYNMSGNYHTLSELVDHWAINHLPLNTEYSEYSRY